MRHRGSENFNDCLSLAFPRSLAETAGMFFLFVQTLEFHATWVPKGSQSEAPPGTWGAQSLSCAHSVRPGLWGIVSEKMLGQTQVAPPPCHSPPPPKPPKSSGEPRGRAREPDRKRDPFS